MRVLALSDTPVPWLSRYFDRRRLESYDVVVACGDLPRDYLETIASLSRVTVLYVRGNHDAAFVDDPPGGCLCVEDGVFLYKGLHIAGLGGSLPYNDRVYGFTEKQMRRRARRTALLVRAAGGLDLLVTHAPVQGYGDLPDYPHRGFEAFGELLDRARPQVMAHGHVHMEYGRVARELAHPSGTRLINACGWQEFELEPGPRTRAWLKPRKLA